MAVSTIYTPVRGNGNGATQAFAFAFKIALTSDIVAYKGSAANPTVWTKGVLNVDYTVTFDPIAETGTVNWTVAPVNLGYSLIGRASNETQGTVYPRDNALPAKSTEACVDKLTLMAQELFSLLQAVPAFPPTTYQPPPLKIQTPATRRAMVYVDNGDGSFNIVASVYDPDTAATQAAASAAAALVSQNAAAVSAAAALASQTAAAASAASAATIAAALQLSGLYAARPAAPAGTTIYYSTDRDSAELWLPAANRWFLLG